MDILDKIIYLLGLQGRRQNELTDHIGVGKSIFSAWKSGKSYSFKKYLPEIADFFSISVDELVGEYGDSMTFRQIIECLCEQNGENLDVLCKNITLDKSILFNPNNITADDLPKETISKIAKYFNVHDKFLYNERYYDPCPLCGLFFDKNTTSDIKTHERVHAAWKLAVEKFGFCWEPVYRNEVKNIASGLISNESSSKEEVYKGCVLLIQVYFSRSLAGCGYSLKHIDFEKYCAALLGQEEYSKRIPESVFKSLVNEYGTNDLIPSGTYYVIPKTEQAEDERIDLTQQEETLLSNYRQLNPDGQKKVDGYVEDLVKGGLYPAEEGEEYIIAARTFGKDTSNAIKKIRLKKREGAGSLTDEPDYKL